MLSIINQNGVRQFEGNISWKQKFDRVWFDILNLLFFLKCEFKVLFLFFKKNVMLIEI